MSSKELRGTSAAEAGKHMAYNFLHHTASITIHNVDAEGATLLHICASRVSTAGAGEIFRILVESSARVDVQDNQGQIPLMCAIRAIDEGSCLERIVLQQNLKMFCSDISPSMVHSTDGAGRSLMHVCAEKAAVSESADVCKLLIQGKCQINAKDFDGQAPLTLAFVTALSAPEEQQPNATCCIQQLLGAGASIENLDEWRPKSHPLWQDLSTPATSQMIRLLQDAGASIPWHPRCLTEAVKTCNVHVVKQVLGKLGDNAEFALCNQDTLGRTPLHSCVQNCGSYGTPEITLLLIEHKALLNVRDTSGNTLASTAIESALATADVSQQESALRVVLALLANGITSHTEAKHAWTSGNSRLAETATLPMGSAVAEMLLAFGVDLPWHSKSLRQAVQAADKVAVKSALARDPEIIKDLVQAADEDGTTLLHICARNSAKRGASKIAYMLIDCMAQVDVEDAAGQTPLAVAISTSLSCKASCLARCLRTVTEILVAGKSSGVMWTIQKACGSAASEVAKVVQSPGNKLVDLMHIFGVDLAAFHEEERIQQRCSKLGIPFELIGAASASRLLNVHTDWQRMIVRELRAECEL